MAERAIAVQFQTFLDDVIVCFLPCHRIEMILITLMNDLQRYWDQGNLALLVLLCIIATTVVDVILLTHHLTDTGRLGSVLQWLSLFSDFGVEDGN